MSCRDTCEVPLGLSAMHDRVQDTCFIYDDVCDFVCSSCKSPKKDIKKERPEFVRSWQNRENTSADFFY
jgi:hypothetical protein